MIIGTDKERKADSRNCIIEWRVGVTPGAVERLIQLGHTCLIESNAGAAAGYSDGQYLQAGAEIVSTQEEIYARADMIYKVKEPQRSEWGLFKKGQILFTYIHSGNREEMLACLLKNEVVGIAYEDVMMADGRLPMLEPMSIIAGHISQQKAYRYLLADEGNVGIISGNLAGVSPAKVVILGIGYAGEAAIREAHGSGSQVIALYRNDFTKADRIMRTYPGVVCLRSTSENVRRALEGSHVLNNCMTWPISLRNEVLVTTAMLQLMDPHGIIVDVSAELQGGVETTRGLHTSHAEPVVQREGKAHYVVPNIPAIVARSASEALVNVTLPWAEIIAGGWDWRKASTDSPLYLGLTCAGGQVINYVVKEWYESICK
ncbi:alanine dehydrogenase [Candidatus Roizmanbacteria bacterium]|nr:alanine dehydrogenase [Candidatus Roizmanbacteria bacterium]